MSYIKDLNSKVDKVKYEQDLVKFKGFNLPNVTMSNWSPIDLEDVDSGFYIVIEHNLGTKDIYVSGYDTDTNSALFFSWELINENRIKVKCSMEVNASITVFHANNTLTTDIEIESGQKITVDDSVISNTNLFTSSRIDNTYVKKGELDKHKSDVNISVNTKVDKVVNKSLVSDEEILRLSKIKNYDDAELKKEIAKVRSYINDIESKIEEPVTLDKCDKKLLEAIENKEGISTFDLLSIPRDTSVNTQKLADTVRNTLYELDEYDDTNIIKKGAIGVNSIYIVDHQYENCIIESVTVKFTQSCEGQLLILENNDGILTKKEIIDFSTSDLGSLKPTIDVHCKVNKAYIGITRNSSSDSVDFGPFNDNYSLLTYPDKTSETIPLNGCSAISNFALPFKVKAYSFRVIDTEKLKSYVKKEENITDFMVVDKNGGGHYTNLQDALDHYNGIPIYVRNGVYEEGRLDCHEKSVTVIGEDKYNVKVVNYGGSFGNDCLYASKGNFSNMSFISELKEDVTPDLESEVGAFAVHIDCEEQADGNIVFNNCIMISDFNASVGGGLRDNNLIELNNCDLISRQEGRGQDHLTGGMGALLIHNNSSETGDNCTEQTVRLNNCRIKAKLENVIRLQEVSKENASATLDINNCLVYSETNGTTNVIKYDECNSFEEMNVWKLSDTSYGNTVKELNKF